VTNYDFLFDFNRNYDDDDGGDDDDDET